MQQELISAQEEKGKLTGIISKLVLANKRLEEESKEEREIVEKANNELAKLKQEIREL